MSYETYICVQDLFLSYRSYTCLTELILVFQIFFFFEGTRRYNKSEQIRIISHTRSEQTYTDTRLIRYRTYQIQEYPLVLQDLLIYRSTRRYYRTYTETGVSVGTTELNCIQEYPYLLQSFIRDRSTHRYYRTYSDEGVPVGTTGLNQRQNLIRDRT